MIWLKSHGGGSGIEKTFENNINLQKTNNNLFMNNKSNQKFRHARSGSASAETQYSNYSSQRSSHNLKSSNNSNENYVPTTINNTNECSTSNANTRRSFHMDELKHLEALSLVRRAHQKQKQLIEIDKTKAQSSIKPIKSPPSVSQIQQFRYGQRLLPVNIAPIIPTRQHNIQKPKNYYQHQILFPQETVNKKNFFDENITENTHKIIGNTNKCIKKSNIIYSYEESQKLNDFNQIAADNNRKNSDTISIENVNFLIIK